MKVRQVRMRVSHWLVPVLVGVRFRSLAAGVRVLVVLVVDMRMRVRHALMRVIVTMRFR
jgi:hypothetical protein